MGREGRRGGVWVRVSASVCECVYVRVCVFVVREREMMGRGSNRVGKGIFCNLKHVREERMLVEM